MPSDRATRQSRKMRRALAGPAVYALVALGLASCIATPPRAGSISGESRLSLVEGRWPGLERPVEILWDEHLIPSIRAESDADGAYALGLVHAHLRLSQMELIRRISQGRLAEMTGPIAAGIDEGIRAIDLDRAVPRMTQELPPATRAWIEGYVAGVNAYRETVARWPADARVLALDKSEAWTVEDVLTLGRLASVDVHWGRWLGLLPLRDAPGGEEFLARVWAFGGRAEASFGGGERTELSVLTDIGRSGSNAVVVSGRRSASGGALVATDPHLGLPQPNIWCVVGIRTPSMNAAGLTIPGLPFVLVGRNESASWSGTNMQATSSVLYRLETDWTPLSERVEPISVRWWLDREAKVRESALGPVITDAALLGRLGEGDLAFRWRGHEPSDEATAFLRLMHCRDWAEFREAFETYAVSGQNMLYADAAGNIGQVMALEAIPAAAEAGRIGPVPASDPEFAWGEGIPSGRLPAAFNPEKGFLVSANNVPTHTEPVLVPQGNANDRVVRMEGLLAGEGPVTLAELARLQTDTYSIASHETARKIAERGAALELSEESGRLVEAIAAWDGFYGAASTGAVAYQTALSTLIDELYEDRYGPQIRSTMRQGPYVHEFVREDLGAAPAEAVQVALDRAAKTWDPSRTWGDVHRLRLAHPLGMVPLLGGAYSFDELGVGGSTTTIMKSAHRVTEGSHRVTFGANARLLFDMGTLDENLVVLLGGQDGWLGSDRLLDQVPLWVSGRAIPLPLSREGQEARAERTTTLRPGDDR